MCVCVCVYVCKYIECVCRYTNKDKICTKGKHVIFKRTPSEHLRHRQITLLLNFFFQKMTLRF